MNFSVDNLNFIYYYFFFSLALVGLYPAIDRLCTKYLITYNEIYPKHKQIYFVSNIIKGFVLGLYSNNAYYILITYYDKGIWLKPEIKYLGAIYSALDLVSIYKVPKMQSNTIIHHIIVQFMYILPLLVLDFDENTISNGIVIYAIFSTFAFMVNIYLGLRLILSNKILKVLASISSIIYILCCSINWSYQLHFLYTKDIGILTKILYGGALSFVVFDDIVLIKFLNRNSFLN